MIYRIFFQPSGAFWCVQFREIFFWQEVKAKVDGEAKLQVKKFDTLAAAEEFCSATGIDMAYHRAQTTSYVTAILSGAKSEDPMEIKEVRELGESKKVLTMTEFSGPDPRTVSVFRGA